MVDTTSLVHHTMPVVIRTARTNAKLRLDAPHLPTLTIIAVFIEVAPIEEPAITKRDVTWDQVHLFYNLVKYKFWERNFINSTLPNLPIMLFVYLSKVNDPCNPNPCNMKNATGETCIVGICNCGRAPCPEGDICDKGVCSRC